MSKPTTPNIDPAVARREAILAGDEGVLPDGKTIAQAREEFLAAEKAAYEKSLKLAELAGLTESKKDQPQKNADDPGKK